MSACLLVLNIISLNEIKKNPHKRLVKEYLFPAVPVFL